MNNICGKFIINKIMKKHMFALQYVYFNKIKFISTNSLSSFCEIKFNGNNFHMFISWIDYYYSFFYWTEIDTHVWLRLTKQIFHFFPDSDNLYS